MGLIERLNAAVRAFAAGTAAVRAADVVWGYDASAYAPEEYGSYVSTSNAVYACATLRSGLLGSLPARIYRTRAGSAERSEVVSGPLYELLRQVNPFWTFRRLIEMTEMTLCVWGEAYWFLERGESGLQTPREIWWARPDRVRVVPHPEMYIGGYLLYPVDGGAPIAYRPNEVIWLRYANPVEEFAPLSPLSAARLAADYASAAMKSNLALFRNGIQAGGLIAPRNGMTFTREQAEMLMESLERRFQGADRAHRWGVMRSDVEVTTLGMTPQDAEFIQGLNWSLEDVARAYRVPLDLVGGQRTYENVRAAMRAIWINCLLPEASFIASELTEQLLPLFPGQGDVIEFDTAGVEVLQEDATERWQRARSQIETGVLTINEWRRAVGMPEVPWGDVWWAPGTLLAVRDDLADGSSGGTVAPNEVEAGLADEARRGMRAVGADGLAYGGTEHRRVWGRFVRRVERYEEWVTGAVRPVMEAQRDSLVDRVKQLRAEQRGLEEEWFDMAGWVRRFREAIRPTLRRVVQDAGVEALDDLGLLQVFDVSEALVVRFLAQRAQRFAEAVNETTWEMLKRSLDEGMAAGENVPELAERVLEVMGERIRSTPETIARTEAMGAANGGMLEAWRQSGVVRAKRWIAALDDRTRDTHVEAHGQTVGLDEEFEVGGARGPAPGLMNDPDEDINCRCTIGAVV